MHYHAEIWLKTNKDVETQIENILRPYDEENKVIQETEEWTDSNGRYHEETYWTNPNGFYDWYQIGGRYTGSHDNYDPYKDRRNWRTCRLCEGTGYRNDTMGKEMREKDPSYTCNACGHYDHKKKQWTHGDTPQGMEVVWPTQFAEHKGDIIPVDQVTEDLTCYTLIISKDILHIKEWTGENFVKTGFDGKVKQELDQLGITDGYLVTVDYHS